MSSIVKMLQSTHQLWNHACKIRPRCILKVTLKSSNLSLSELVVCLLPPAVNSGGGQIRSADRGKHGSRSGKQEVQLTIRETAFLPQNFLPMGGKIQIIELGRWEGHR